ncbi:hypothetical protein FJZ26_03970 [Candidatus Parvarchaeota archaeon]|nr:hypothetical protein [Candidatus Parvarchaeota archaeon]
MKIIPGQSISFMQLFSQGIPKREILDMAKNLYLFPTPFKGIYYVPSNDERRGWLVEKPPVAMRQAMGIYLSTSKFYYSCATAEEFHGISWHPSSELHVVNSVRSGKIDLQVRIGRNRLKKTWRAKQVARILEFFPGIIIFHKVPSIDGAKFKDTPYGRFATRSQIRIDKKRFREK